MSLADGVKEFFTLDNHFFYDVLKGVRTGKRNNEENNRFARSLNLFCHKKTALLCVVK